MDFQGCHVFDYLLVHWLIWFKLFAYDQSKHIKIEFHFVVHDNFSILGSFQQINQSELRLHEVLFLELHVLVVKLINLPRLSL